MTPLIKDTMQWMFKTGLDPADLHWFDISGAVERDFERLKDRLWLWEYRPPFEKNMVLFSDLADGGKLGEVFMTVVGSDPYEGIIVSAYFFDGKKKPTKVPSFVYKLEIEDGEESIRYAALDEKNPISDKEIRWFIFIIAAWYRALSYGCVAYTAEKKVSFTSKRKAAQGKKPTYEWRTVLLDPQKPQPPKKPHLGGTHASPRLHDRRGHMRKLKSGKSVWVRSCKVGKAELGVVFHDYAVRQDAHLGGI